MPYNRSEGVSFFAHYRLSLLLGFCVIIMRLFYIQVYQNFSFLSRSKRNYLRYESIKPQRGAIEDCNGVLLATNRPVVKLLWQGRGKRKLTVQDHDSLQQMQALLHIDLPDRKMLMRAERDRKQVVLCDQVNFDQLSLILEHFAQHEHIQVETEFQRYYPYQSVACHMIGYIGVSSNHNVGIMGLEKICEDRLCGISGQRLITINSSGQQIAHQEIQKAIGGSAIRTTLDIRIQQLIERAFPADMSGACIVMEASTGALRAVVSRPGFDPNAFTTPLASQEWQRLLLEKAFINRAFSACYPPASLFKLVTMTAALDTHLIDGDEQWFCPGYTIFCGRPYQCMNKRAHGVVSIKDAIEQSCNIPFYDIARRLKVNIDLLAAYAQFLGLGHTSKHLFSEKAGLIPTRQWKQDTIGEPWWPGETLSACIGQTYMSITLVQACRMIGTLCEGYTVTPHLIEGCPIERIVPPISPAVLAQIKDSMQWVTTHKGTAKLLKNMNKKMKIYGKTGTAQTQRLQTNADLFVNKAALSHKWFAAHVAYKDHPPFVIVILVEHAGNANIAVETVNKFLNLYKKELSENVLKA